MLAHKLGCPSLSHPGGSARAPGSRGSISDWGPASRDLRLHGGRAGGGLAASRTLLPAPSPIPLPQPPPTCWGVFASAKSGNIFSSHFLGAHSP